jgi:hypothetical protein
MADTVQTDPQLVEQALQATEKIAGFMHRKITPENREAAGKIFGQLDAQTLQTYTDKLTSEIDRRNISSYANRNPATASVQSVESLNVAIAAAEGGNGGHDPVAEGKEVALMNATEMLIDGNTSTTLANAPHLNLPIFRRADNAARGFANDTVYGLTWLVTGAQSVKSGWDTGKGLWNWNATPITADDIAGVADAGVDQIGSLITGNKPGTIAEHIEAQKAETAERMQEGPSYGGGEDISIGLGIIGGVRALPELATLASKIPAALNAARNLIGLGREAEDVAKLAKVGRVEPPALKDIPTKPASSEPSITTPKPTEPESVPVKLRATGTDGPARTSSRSAVDNGGSGPKVSASPASDGAAADADGSNVIKLSDFKRQNGTILRDSGPKPKEPVAVADTSPTGNVETAPTPSSTLTDGTIVREPPPLNGDKSIRVFPEDAVDPSTIPGRAERSLGASPRLGTPDPETRVGGPLASKTADGPEPATPAQPQAATPTAPSNAPAAASPAASTNAGPWGPRPPTTRGSVPNVERVRPSPSATAEPNPAGPQPAAANDSAADLAAARRAEELHAQEMRQNEELHAERMREATAKADAAEATKGRTSQNTSGTTSAPGAANTGAASSAAKSSSPAWNAIKTTYKIGTFPFRAIGFGIKLPFRAVGLAWRVGTGAISLATKTALVVGGTWLTAHAADIWKKANIGPVPSSVQTVSNIASPVWDVEKRLAQGALWATTNVGIPATAWTWNNIATPAMAWAEKTIGATPAAAATTEPAKAITANDTQPKPRKDESAKGAPEKTDESQEIGATKTEQTPGPVSAKPPSGVTAVAAAESALSGDAVRPSDTSVSSAAPAQAAAPADTALRPAGPELAITVHPHRSARQLHRLKHETSAAASRDSQITADLNMREVVRAESNELNGTNIQPEVLKELPKDIKSDLDRLHKEDSNLRTQLAARGSTLTTGGF